MTSTKKQTWDVLEDVLSRMKYNRDLPPSGQRFQLHRDDESNYAVLDIYTYNPNTYYPTEMRHTRHEFVVPVCTYHAEAWFRWVFDRIVSVEIHETCENVTLDDVRVYAPHHGNGWDPYTFWPSHHISEKLKAPGDP